LRSCSELAGCVSASARFLLLVRGMVTFLVTRLRRGGNVPPAGRNLSASRVRINKIVLAANDG
jgi:hypothetical protein